MKSVFKDTALTDVINILDVILNPDKRLGPVGAEISKEDNLSSFEISQKFEN